MTDQGKKYLSDIVYAIELIEQFIYPINKFEDYMADLKTQSAVERQLGIIGEAVIKYNNLLPENNLLNAEKIRGFRNRLIHAYDNIDPTIIWAIIQNHIAPLKKEALDKLKTL
jgi:uncharacterized protein with HEPN domain